MSGLGGILGAALALIALEVVATSTSATGGLSNFTSLAAYPGELAARWMSPDVALIPVRGSGSPGAPAAAAPPASSGAQSQGGSMQLSTLAQPS